MKLPRPHPGSSSGSCSASGSHAFTLLELLLVIAIIALLAAAITPVFNSIGQARGVTEAAYQVAAAVELARSEAVARQTYVWLGLQPQTNSGNLDLRIGLVYSKDGSGTNTAAANLQPIGKAILIQRTALVDPSGWGAGEVGTSLGTFSSFPASGGLTFTNGKSAFTGRTVTFTPLGEVMTNSAPSATDGFDPRIAIGLRQSRGTTPATGNDIAVVIDGSVGIPTLYRK
jgi:prepilin-type N-terminal cleavage/methylation domain-containing protein